MNTSQIKALQERIGTTPDGFWGRMSIAACQRHLRDLMPSPNPWPNSDEASLQAFYGAAGDESKLVNLDVSGLGVKYEGTPVKTVRCHERISVRLHAVLVELAVTHPEVLADYNGCYNFRKMRGGSSYSLHARGAAIDFLAGSNGNHAHWPTNASMPITVMEAFCRQGFLPAGAFWQRDGMHHQATR